MAPGEGLLELGVGLVDGVGGLHVGLDHRVSETVSVFASGNVDMAKNWGALGGLRVRF